MKRLLGLLVVAVSLFSACEPIEPGGGGGGPVGDGTFTKGFVYVRSDNNIYAADSADYQTTIQLTTNGNNKHPSLSANGKTVVFVHTDGQLTSLMTVPAASGQSTSTLLNSDSTKKNFSNPVFSPDGAKIAFKYENGATSFIGLMNSDGSGFQALTPSTLSFGAPAFFPDGSAIIAPAGNSTSTYDQIQKVSLTGNTSTVLSSLGSEALNIVNRIVVAPNATQAAFDARVSSGSNRIFIVSLNAGVGGTVRQLTDHPGEPGANDSFPTFTSNTEVGFSSDTGGADQVYTAQTSGTKVGGTLTVPSALQPWFGPVGQ
ncbi:MAG: TolB family protein [Myxococcaceae bacterium]